MNSASVFLGLVVFVGAALAVPPGTYTAAGVPVLGGWGGVAVVPPGLTVAASAKLAASQQLAYQLAQARGAAIQDAINSANAAQSLGNQANNAAVRNSISQANAERVQNANNLAQAARNALAQAQAAQIQIAQANAAAARNSAVQTLQGNNAGAIQATSTLNELAFANGIATAPILLDGAIIGSTPILAGSPILAGPSIAVGRAPLAVAVSQGSGEDGARGQASRGSRGQEGRGSRGQDGRGSRGQEGGARGPDKASKAEDSEAVEAVRHSAPTSSKLSSSHLSASAGVGWGRKG